MLALLAFAAAPRELGDYLRKPDAAYRYDAKPGKHGGLEIDLTSGDWQGTTWRHQVLFQQPPKLAAKGVGILYITGDGPTNGDRTVLSMTSAGTGMPVAMLFNVPNQPLWGMKEDDLIAHTFQKYLETGDASWPLLFPMTRAAVRAMDAVQDATKNTDNPIRRFVVCGASKRGWTTWMVGASGDRRVVGIAPMVIDNLNLQAQMPHQLASWGEYSPMIQDYTRRGLQAALATPRGRQLGEIVDPYSYREQIRMPALIVRGSNDPYWTVDALDQYESGLKMPHWLLNVPNAGHDLEGGLKAAESIGAFARSLAGGPKLPKLDWSWPTIAGQEWVRLRTSGPKPKAFRIWVAKSGTLDFRPSEYHKVAELTFDKGFPNQIEEPIPFSRDANAAAFVELRFVQGGRAFSLSSPTRVFRK